MNIVNKIQAKDFNVGEFNFATDLEQLLKQKDLKQVYIVAGIIKDEGYVLLEKAFDTAKNNGAEVNFVLGIDRKTISENVLKKIMEVSNTVHIYNNNVSEDTFSAKLVLLVYVNKAIAVLPTVNFTANGITIDHANFTYIEFDMEKDLNLYNDFMFSIKEYIYPDEDIFKELTEKQFEQLVLNRELLVSKTTDLKLPSINDYLKKAAEVKSTIQPDNNIEEKIKKESAPISKDFDVELNIDDMIE